jgi:hypothetical protein
MRLQEIARSLDLNPLTPLPEATRDHDITQGYASDLLSDILANAPPGGILVTLQVQPDVITVAGIAGLRAIIFCCDRVPEHDAIARAEEEGLCLYVTSADTFAAVGRLYALGVEGRTAPDRRGGGSGRRVRLPNGREATAPVTRPRQSEEGASLAPGWTGAICSPCKEASARDGR